MPEPIKTQQIPSDSKKALGKITFLLRNSSGMLEKKSADYFLGETIWDVFCREFKVSFREEKLGPRITEVNGVASEFYHFFLSGGKFSNKGLPFTRTWFGKKLYLDLRHIGASKALDGLMVDVTLVSSCSDLSHSVKKRFDKIFYAFKVDEIKEQVASRMPDKRDLLPQPKNQTQNGEEIRRTHVSLEANWLLWQMFQRKEFAFRRTILKPNITGLTEPSLWRGEEAKVSGPEWNVQEESNAVALGLESFNSLHVRTEGLMHDLPENSQSISMAKEIEVLPIFGTEPAGNFEVPAPMASVPVQMATSSQPNQKSGHPKGRRLSTASQGYAEKDTKLASRPVPLAALKDFKAAIFDLDGVMVDSEKAHLATFRQAFSKFGMEIPSSYWKRNYTGIGSRAIVEDLFGKNGIKESVHSMVGQRAEIYQKYVEKNGLPAMPGVIQALALLRNSGIKAIVASGGHRSHIAASLKSIGVSGMQFIGHEDVKQHKPSPDTFLLAAEKLEAKPSECIVFEDSLSGIQAAASAGMVCVALSTTLPVSQLRGKAAIVVKDFNSPKLRKLLSRLVAKRKEAATASEKHGGRKRGKGKQQSSGRPPVAPAKKRLGKRLRRPVLIRLK